MINRISSHNSAFLAAWIKNLGWHNLQITSYFCLSWVGCHCIDLKQKVVHFVLLNGPRVGSRVVRIDPLHFFVAGCHKRWLYHHYFAGYLWFGAFSTCEKTQFWAKPTTRGEQFFLAVVESLCVWIIRRGHSGTFGEFEKKWYSVQYGSAMDKTSITQKLKVLSHYCYYQQI